MVFGNENNTAAGQKSQLAGDCGGRLQAPVTSPAARSLTSGISRRDDVMLPPPSHQSTSAFYGQ